MVHDKADQYCLVLGEVHEKAHNSLFQCPLGCVMRFEFFKCGLALCHVRRSGGGRHRPISVMKWSRRLRVDAILLVIHARYNVAEIRALARGV